MIWAGSGENQVVEIVPLITRVITVIFETASCFNPNSEERGKTESLKEITNNAMSGEGI